MRACIKLFLLFLFFISSFATAKNQLLQYEPEIVELTGIVKIFPLPGSPNYLDTRTGDAEETNPYLILKNPIDIEPSARKRAGTDYELRKNIKILCVVAYNDVDQEKLKDGVYVHVKGTLFYPTMGNHQHAGASILAKKIRILPKKKIVADDLTITQEDYEYLGGEDKDQYPKPPLKVLK